MKEGSDAQTEEGKKVTRKERQGREERRKEGGKKVTRRMKEGRK